ncbi:MAG: hypothetical protein WC812_03375 [Candidatus Pacearchaeota archaeon]|jgi:hypothetical protein
METEFNKLEIKLKDGEKLELEIKGVTIAPTYPPLKNEEDITKYLAGTEELKLVCEKNSQGKIYFIPRDSISYISLTCKE